MNPRNDSTGWRFVDQAGTFVLQDPHRTSYLYFPLVNEAGMISSITPMLHGDIKTGQNSFLMAPVSVEDLHNSRSARNFWVVVERIEGAGAWSAAGNSAPQVAASFAAGAEQVTLEAGFLWHKVTRESPQFGLRAEITSIVPPSGDQVELMQVTLTNVSDRRLAVTPTAAIPIYGRSADNLRDHRHVTSLLHRISTHPYGVLVCPTLSFDERGHRPNSTTYGVLGAEGDGAPPQSFCPIVEDFIGEGGCLEWPEAIVRPSDKFYPAGQEFEGYEAIGALRFGSAVLEPGQSKSYIVIMAVMREDSCHSEPRSGQASRFRSIETLREAAQGDKCSALVNTYGSESKFADWFRRNEAHWQSKLETLAFHTGEGQFDLWLKWVALQPILRRLIGNSFLPYHDYGRGGRGWRDLWQDCLALLMMEPDQAPGLLFGSYGGVRIDGSNATIIGSQPGEFLADRNNIARVWMDHGAWPFLTTRLYIDQSGDLAFLLREQTYFKDQHINRSRGIDQVWQPDQGTLLRTTSGQVYRGTVLEHLLVQHLTAFFNVGAFGNNIKLEDADWNDGMDMAPERGESVAFTTLYASNLRDLSQLVLELGRQGITRVELASKLMLLLDTLAERVDYASVEAKQKRLHDYLTTCRHVISGDKTSVSIRDLSRDLAAKADWLTHHLRTHEWICSREGYEWFNGYYDNDGARVEGDHPNGVRMTLTGQVFALMGRVATDEQAQQIVRAADRYLYDAAVGGYRLNTDFGEVLLNLGRCFGFAFGAKENGAMFSHMAVMYANALYRRGLVRAGCKVLDGIYQHCRNFSVSRVYPGIPEYINARGRGAYPFLTGAASWLLLTLLTEAFGVKGKLGDLVLEPKLVREQFDKEGLASVEAMFAGKKLRVVYHNLAKRDYGAYRIEAIQINGKPVSFEREARSVVLAREAVAALAEGQSHRVDVTLGET